ncbi:MAG: ThiF family adenylyltransferase, partial [Fusobacterium sp.]
MSSGFFLEISTRIEEPKIEIIASPICEKELVKNPKITKIKIRLDLNNKFLSLIILLPLCSIFILLFIQNEKIIKNYDYIVDGTDNFESKFLINDLSLKYKKFLVTGAISKFDGHIFTFNFTNKK